MDKIYEYLKKNSIVAALLIAGIIWVLIQLKVLLAVLFLAYLIVVALLRPTRFLRARGFPNVLAVLLPYLAVLTIIGIIIVPFFSVAAEQLQAVTQTLSVYAEKINSYLKLQGVSMQDVGAYIASQIKSFASNLVGITRSLASASFYFFTVLTLSIYSQLDYDRIKAYVITKLSGQTIVDPALILNNLEIQQGSWVRGQIALCLIIGILSYAVLKLLGINFAASLALLAALLEVLPNIGPVLAAIPAVLIGLQQSLTQGLLVAAAYTGIQLLENTVIVPKVMGKAVNLHPIVIIPAIIIGSQFMGILGAILAIPLLTAGRIVWASLQKPGDKSTIG